MSRRSSKFLQRYWFWPSNQYDVALALGLDVPLPNSLETFQMRPAKRARYAGGRYLSEQDSDSDSLPIPVDVSLDTDFLFGAAENQPSQQTSPTQAISWTAHNDTLDEGKWRSEVDIRARHVPLLLITESHAL
mgnify:CR=1 FL=1